MIDLLKKFKPYKILGKGTQGIIILEKNNEIAIKIFINKPRNLKMLIKIINFFKNKNCPKTICKTLFLSESKNSLQRYLINNNLPQYFSYVSDDNLEILSKKYNMKPLLFQIMKKYDITLNDFINNLFINNNSINNNSINIKIISSLLYQGIFTLIWLYMKKGIIHFDINSDNFFIEKTNNTEFNIEINNIIYKVPLYGYYLIIADFGYSKSIELVEPKDYNYNIHINLKAYIMHPYDDLSIFIKIFRKYFLNFNISLFDFDINLNKCNSLVTEKTKIEYRNMIISYYNQTNDYKLNTNIFKNKYFHIIKKYILNNK